jgi:hypothetical protein
MLSGCWFNQPVSFDAELWKSDRNGCNKDRLEIYKEILDKQEEVLGLSNRQIINLLGKPERNELYKRNQKFFIYYITPSSECDNQGIQDKLYMFIRFNAVGLSQEIFVQEKPGFNK